MKQNNINALRCSHYPNPEVLYEQADRLGIYVVDEANVESHGLRHRIPASGKEWTANSVERMERMVPVAQKSSVLSLSGRWATKPDTEIHSGK